MQRLFNVLDIAKILIFYLVDGCLSYDVDKIRIFCR